MRPETLRSQVQFSLSLTLWLGVDEEPPFVPFERQACFAAESIAPPRS